MFYKRRTDTNINLSGTNFSSDLVNGGKTGRALSVDSVYSSGIRNPSWERRHTSSDGSSTRRTDISNRNVFDQGGVEFSALVNSSEDLGKVFLRKSVFETTLATLLNK